MALPLTVDELVRLADRFDGLAETAELMGDDDGAERFRRDAADRRSAAMRLLDERGRFNG